MNNTLIEIRNNKNEILCYNYQSCREICKGDYIYDNVSNQPNWKVTHICHRCTSDHLIIYVKDYRMKFKEVK